MSTYFNYINMGYFTDNNLNINKAIRFADYPYYKRLNANGELMIYTNEEALSNAFSIWLTSAQFENLRSLTGGVLYKHIGKVMNQDRANQIKNDIILGAESEFKPKLTFVTLDVVPDYDKNLWKVSISAFNVEYNIGFSSAIVLNNY